MSGIVDKDWLSRHPECEQELEQRRPVGQSEPKGRKPGSKRTPKSLVNRNQKAAFREKDHYSVYVIELDSAVLQDRPRRVRKLLSLNPNRDPEKPCVYVGMTGLTVQKRFQNHKDGHQDAPVVKKYGLQLIPELYEHLNPMAYEVAVQTEKDLAENLRADGYTVAGGK
jgi:hypothetical protein